MVTSPRAVTLPPELDAETSSADLEPDEESRVDELEESRVDDLEAYLQAISDSKLRLQDERRCTDEAREREADLRAKAVRRPRAPDAAGHFRCPGSVGREFNPWAPLHVAFVEPMKYQAMLRPERVYDRSASPPFAQVSQVPRAFPSQPLPLPPCTRRPPFPGFPSHATVPPLRQPASARGARPRTASAGPTASQASAKQEQALSVRYAWSPSELSASGRTSALPKRRSATPRCGSAMASRMEGVRAICTPPPWVPGRATPCDLERRAAALSVPRPRTAAN